MSNFMSYLQEAKLENLSDNVRELGETEDTRNIDHMSVKTSK